MCQADFAEFLEQDSGIRSVKGIGQVAPHPLGMPLNRVDGFGFVFNSLDHAVVRAGGDL